MEGIERFSKDRKCPVCGGCDGEPRSRGTRCHGFLRGSWVHCTREEHAGQAKFSPTSKTWAHKLKGKCPCGSTHGAASAPERAEIDHIYKYRNIEGQVLFEVVRYRNPKGFKQRIPLGGGRYAWSLKGRVPVLYQLPALKAAPLQTPVWIVEGEKDVDRLGELGLLATCNAMGAGKWRDIYADTLLGRVCYIVPDNDEPGKDHAREVARSLKGRAASVKIVELPGVPEKGDVSDYLAQGGAMAQLQDLATQAPEWEPSPGAQDEPPAAPFLRPSSLDVLMVIAKEAELWRTPAGDGYCTLNAAGRQEHHPVHSTAVIDWLVHAYVTKEDRAPSPDALNQVLMTLKAKARFSKSVFAAEIRVGADPKSEVLRPVSYIDLADDPGHAVRVSAGGWEVITDPPVRFRRPKGTGPIPLPERNRDIDDLWEFVNVEESDRILVLALLTYALLPTVPQPIAVLTGEQGSAKSATTEVYKRLVDPRRPMLSSPPQDVRDLAILAANTRVMAFDNLSAVRPWFSDMLCRLAYGVGFETRTLCTNDELTSFEYCRPCVVNGIEDLVNRLDLLDRAVILNCPTLNPTAYVTYDAFWAKFERAQAALFGALLDAIVGGMQRMPELGDLEVPRMGTFARWGEAVCRSLGYDEGEFMERFLDNQKSASADILEDSPLIAELKILGRKYQSWQGTPSQLFDLLNENASASNRSNLRWPKGARSLSCQLKRLSPGLRKQKIDVTLAQRVHNSRQIRIEWQTHEEHSPPPVAAFAHFAPFAPQEANGHANGKPTQGHGGKDVPF